MRRALAPGSRNLVTDDGELPLEAGEAEYREVWRIGGAAGIPYTGVCDGYRQGRSLTVGDPAGREPAIAMRPKLLEDYRRGSPGDQTRPRATQGSSDTAGMRRHWHEPDEDGALTALAWKLATAFSRPSATN